MVKKSLPCSNDISCTKALFNLCLCKATVEYDVCVLTLAENVVNLHAFYRKRDLRISYKLKLHSFYHVTTQSKFCFFLIFFFSVKIGKKIWYVNRNVVMEKMIFYKPAF